MGTPLVSLPGAIPQRLFQEPIADDRGLVTTTWQKFFQSLPRTQKIPTIVQSTHANRATLTAGSYAQGSIYYETDRQLYYFSISNAWVYFAGILQVTQANIPTDLATPDTNLLINVTDFNHLLQWNGTGFSFAPGDSGGGYTVPFVNPPNPITGWQLADGSANVATLNGDSTLSFVTVPSIVGSYFRQ